MNKRNSNKDNLLQEIAKNENEKNINDKGFASVGGK
jgi:hypothetical protein